MKGKVAIPGVAFKALLLLADLAAFTGLFILVQNFRFDHFSLILLSSPGFWFIALMNLAFLYIAGQYDFRLHRRGRYSHWAAVNSVAATFIVTIVVNYLFAKERAGLFGRGILLGAFVAFSAWLFASRWLVRGWQESRADRFRFRFWVTPDYAGSLRRDLEALKIDFDILEPSREAPLEISDDPLFVQERLLPAHPQDVERLALARLQGAPISGLSDFYESYLGKLPVASFNPEWFVLASGFALPARRIEQRMKRLFDLFLATVLLILTAPLLALMTVLIRLESKGPGLYRQIRTGRFGGNFEIIKLRTMRQDAEKDGARWATANDQRITRLGRFLRKTRIDELPQLWNILRGEMSFVGPRPERPEFVADLRRQIPHYDLRHVVVPGVTGWAQVMYPYGASVEDARRKLEYDLFYVKYAGLLIDMKVLLKTVRTVLTAAGR